MNGSKLEIPYPGMYRQPNPTHNFLKLYKQNLYHLLETGDDSSQYLPASLQTGESFVRTNFVRNSNGDQLGLLCSIKQFQRYGVGIYLLFLFLRSTLVIHFLKSLVAIGSLIIMYQQNAMMVGTAGKNFTNEEPTLLNRLSLGNVDSHSPNRETIKIMDMASTVLSIVFIAAWNQFQKQVVIDCAQVTPLPSYYTVVISNLPQQFNQQKDISSIVQRYGPVEDVYTVRNYVDNLSYYKILIETLQEIKLEKAEIQIDQSRNKQRYNQLLGQFYIIYVKIKKMEENASSKAVFVFISFRTIKAREEAVKQLSSQSCLCMGTEKSGKTSPIKVSRCYVQPSGILWENIHISRCQSLYKLVIQLVLVLIVFGGGFVAILCCATFQYMTTLQLSGREGQLQFCSRLNIIQFAKQGTRCSGFRKEYYTNILLSVAVPLIMVMIKELITRVIAGLAYFRRYGSLIELFRSQLLTCWAVYFTTTALIVPIIHLNFGSFTLDKAVQPLLRLVWSSQIVYNTIDTYSECNTQWYINIGQSIILTGIISFGLGYLLDLLFQWVLRRIYNCQASKEKVQKKMNKKLKGSTFGVPIIYAQALTLICFVQLYSVGLPLLHILGTASLGILYVCSKIAFIRFCRTPVAFNETISQLATKLLLVSLLLHNLTSPIILGGTDSTAPKGIIPKIWHYKGYLSISVISIAYFIFRSFIVMFLVRAYRTVMRMHSRDSVLPQRINNIDSTFKESLKINKSQVISYRMDQNPRYKYLLKALYTLNEGSALNAYGNDILTTWNDELTDFDAQNTSVSVYTTTNPFFGISSKRVIIEPQSNVQQTYMS